MSFCASIRQPAWTPFVVNGEKWAHVDTAHFNLICMNKFNQTDYVLRPLFPHTPTPPPVWRNSVVSSDEVTHAVKFKDYVS